MDCASTPDDPGGHVQDAIAKSIDLASGEGRIIGEADELRPCDKVAGREQTLEPRVVLGHLFTGETSQARGLCLADAIFDASVLAMVEFE